MSSRNTWRTITLNAIIRELKMSFLFLMNGAQVLARLKRLSVSAVSSIFIIAKPHHCFALRSFFTVTQMSGEILRVKIRYIS
jgi:hypothetical protein